MAHDVEEAAIVISKLSTPPTPEWESEIGDPKDPQIRYPEFSETPKSKKRNPIRPESQAPPYEKRNSPRQGGPFEVVISPTKPEPRNSPNSVYP